VGGGPRFVDGWVLASTEHTLRSVFAIHPAVSWHAALKAYISRLCWWGLGVRVGDYVANSGALLVVLHVACDVQGVAKSCSDEVSVALVAYSVGDEVGFCIRVQLICVR
jgi:hypothetical protein